MICCSPPSNRANFSLDSDWLFIEFLWFWKPIDLTSFAFKLSIDEEMFVLLLFWLLLLLLSYLSVDKSAFIGIFHSNTNSFYFSFFFSLCNRLCAYIFARFVIKTKRIKKKKNFKEFLVCFAVMCLPLFLFHSSNSPVCLISIELRILNAKSKTNSK